MTELLIALNMLAVQYALWCSWRIQTTHAHPGRWKYALAAALSGAPAAAYSYYLLVVR